MQSAEKAIAPYRVPPQTFPATVPLRKPLPAGTKFVFLQCGSPICGLTGAYVQEAVKTIGGRLTTVNAGETATSAQAAVSSAIAMKPDAVLISGIDPVLFGGGLKKLADAGTKVVSIQVTQAVKPFGIAFNYIGAALNVEDGKLMADWVIAQKGANADAVFYSDLGVDLSTRMQQGFEDEMKAHCPSCKVRVVPQGSDTTAARTVVTDLQAHRSTNVAALVGIPDGLGAELKVGGVSSVKTIGFGPTPGNLQDVKDGGETAALAIDFAVSVWTGIDAAARLIEGDQPTPSELIGEAPQQILQRQDITFDPSNGWSAFPTYAKRFAVLWHTTGQ